MVEECLIWVHVELLKFLGVAGGRFPGVVVWVWRAHEDLWCRWVRRSSVLRVGRLFVAVCLLTTCCQPVVTFVTV